MYLGLRGIKIRGQDQALINTNGHNNNLYAFIHLLQSSHLFLSHYTSSKEAADSFVISVTDICISQKHPIPWLLHKKSDSAHSS